MGHHELIGLVFCPQWMTLSLVDQFRKDHTPVWFETDYSRNTCTTYPSANRVVTKQSQSSNWTKIKCKRTLHSVNINLGLWNLDGVRPCHELESLLQYFGTLSSNVMTHWQSPTVRWMLSILRVDLCSDDFSCGTTGCKTHLRPQVFGSWRSKATVKLKTLLSIIPPRTSASDDTTEDGS